MTSDDRERATFYRAALLLGLLPGDLPIRWADQVLEHAADAPAGFVDISTASPDDLSGLRHALVIVGDEHASEQVVAALLGLIGRDLSSGRRTVQDSMRVLSQLRKFLRVPRALNEEVKALSVQVSSAAAGQGDPDTAEARVRAWLARYENAEAGFLREDSRP